MEGIPTTHFDEATHEVCIVLYWITVYSLVASLCFVIEIISWGIRIDLCIGKRLITWADSSLAEILASETDRLRALKAFAWYVTTPPRALLRIICIPVLIVDRLKH